MLRNSPLEWCLEMNLKATHKHLWLAILLLSLAAACGQEGRGIAIQSTEIVDDPELAHPSVIGKLRPGDEVTVAGESGDGADKLLKIRLDKDKFGWIPAETVQLSDKKGALAVNAFAIVPTNVVSDPSSKNPGFVTRLARGEKFKLIREKTFGNSTYAQVGIVGVDEVAWVKKEDIFVGEKTVLTAKNDAETYDRPDRARSPVGKLPVGKKGYLIDEQGDFYKINVWKGQEHWVLKGTVVEGDVQVDPEVEIPGIGTARLHATSWVDSDVAGREQLYAPQQAFDDSMKTSWQTSKNGGVGESLEMRFDSPVPFLSVEVVNGFAKSDDIYERNNRVTGIKLECLFEGFSKSTRTVQLQDMMQGFQHVGNCENADGVILEILEVADGSQWQDAALSEVRLGISEPEARPSEGVDQQSAKEEPGSSD